MTEYWKMMRLSEKAVSPLMSESPARAPGPDEVVVQLHAAALNFADLLMLKGSYQDTPARPFTPGLEGAGRVLVAGSKTGLQPGTRVAVYSQGTMAQANVFLAAHCVPIPDDMSYEQAAGFLIAYGTSHLALAYRAQLQPGQTLAVLGAAGGVGLTAVEIGAALGARVIAIARGAERLKIARQAGAEICIDSAECPDLRQALRDLGGVDVVYDPVGDAPGAAAFRALRPNGRFLVIGFAGGRPPALPLNHALVKNIAIHGLYWGAYRQLDPQMMRDSLHQLMELFQQGKLRPHVGATLPLARLAEGYDLLESRRSIGKVVVTM